MPTANKLGKVVTHHEELPLKTLHDPSITWFCEVKWHIKYFISPYCTRPMATKHGKVVPLCEGHPPINSHNPLNMYSFEVTRQIKNSIFPLSQCLCLHDLQGWRHTVRKSQPYIYMILWWWVHLQETYGHQIGKVLSYCERLPLIMPHENILLHDQRHVTWQSFQKTYGY